MKDLLRQLPSVNDLLKVQSVDELIGLYSYDRVKEALQQAIDQVRQSILSGDKVDIHDAAIIDEASQQLETLKSSSLKSVINATGTVLHTNLGRALLSEDAIDAMVQVARGYNNLEYSIESGSRGTRYEHIEQIITELTGAESALLVNNNAAAVMLMLTTFTKGKEVLISRGELVEIGGSFRVPEVISSGGAILHEVGSTNKTHLKDYQAGINEETGAILRVHTSNYRVIGFTETVTDRELVELAHSHDLPAFNDLGSGLLIDLQHLGLSYEPTVKEMIDAGYDLVSFSGDKLLGGPQAGIIAGKKSYIDQLKKAPLLRALRSDKVTIAALEATLRAYLNPSEAIKQIPTLQMLGYSMDELNERAQSLSQKLSEIDGIEAKIVDGFSQVGGGSYPGEYLPTKLVNVTTQKIDEATFERELRLSAHHIIPRIHDGKIQFDVRTISLADFDTIVEEVRVILTEY